VSTPEGGIRRRPQATLAVAVLLAVVTALLPLLRVISGGAWLVTALGMIVAVLAAGYIVRWLRRPAIIVSVVEAAVWLVAMTVLFGGGTALLGVIPTPDTLRQVPLLMDAALQQIRDGAAPLDAGAALTFLIVAAAGLLAIAMDHVVVTARMPLLATVGLLAVYLIPSIAVPSGIDLAGFIAFAAAILLMLAVETATRDRSGSSGARGASRVPAGTAAAVGTAAIVAAVAIAPVMPAPQSAGSTVIAVRGNTIDPSLELGQDLRRPQEVEVLTLHSDAPAPPYLRAVTLSEYDGDEWEPDRGVPATLDAGFDPVVVDPDVRVSEYTATIEVRNFVSPWLPIPYPAVGIDGLDGEWSTIEQNRTVLSRQSSPQGQDYSVSYQVPRPTLEQIRETDASVPAGSRSLQLPEGEDEAIGAIRETALAVTASTSTDYDALVALQRWFRSPDFEYSLVAPVNDGFDGSGLEAVQAFLEERSGYCVHFASAFAIMARTLDMPSRIVVGYLPGAPTQEQIDRQTVHTVVSSQLHAWPEVHFAGIGWIPFEPTNSLGVPTGFASGAVSGSADSLTPDAGGAASPAPSSSLAPGMTDGLDESGAPLDSRVAIDPTGPVFLTIAISLALVLPGLWRVVRRRARLREADEGDAGAAWQEVVDTAADLGISSPTGESPRALGRRLVAEHGAPAAAMGVVVGAIERASYAGAAGHATDLADAVRAVRSGLAARADRRDRLSAAVVPRSLLRRGYRTVGGARQAR
jgi:transglutaminase-like putative cysteine protease